MAHEGAKRAKRNGRGRLTLQPHEGDAEARVRPRRVDMQGLGPRQLELNGLR